MQLRGALVCWTLVLVACGGQTTSVGKERSDDGGTRDERDAAAKGPCAPERAPPQIALGRACDPFVPTLAVEQMDLARREGFTHVFSKRGSAFPGDCEYYELEVTLPGLRFSEIGAKFDVTKWWSQAAGSAPTVVSLLLWDEQRELRLAVALSGSADLLSILAEPYSVRLDTTVCPDEGPALTSLYRGEEPARCGPDPSDPTLQLCTVADHKFRVVPAFVPLSSEPAVVFGDANDLVVVEGG